MLILSHLKRDEVARWGRDLMNGYRNKFTSFEEAAQHITGEIYETFQQEDQKPLFALVRIFRLCQYHELLPELQQLVDPAQQFWMALMGTAGDKPEWRDRHLSAGHKVIPAGNQQTPMLKAAFEQLGLKPGELTEASTAFFTGATLTPYFYLAHAPGSPYIPAQEAFIIPYQIKSVVGLGCGFISKSSYLMVAFSKISLTGDDARNFAEMSPFVSTVLASQDARRLYWHSQ